MGPGAHKKGQKPVQKKRLKKSDYEDKEVKEIEKIVEAQKPASGTNPLALGKADVATAGYAAARTFDELPMSNYTKEGLKQHKFVTLTAIQRAALPHALAGRDILGAAKTGSGKTLAFLIPVSRGARRACWVQHARAFHGHDLHAVCCAHLHPPWDMPCSRRNAHWQPRSCASPRVASGALLRHQEGWLYMQQAGISLHPAVQLGQCH